MLFMMMEFFCVHHYEGGPLVALEALSYGLPIITTHVGVFYDFKTNTQKIDSINSFKTIEEANQILDIFRNKKNFYSDNNLQYLEENFLSSTEVVNKKSMNNNIFIAGHNGMVGRAVDERLNGNHLNSIFAPLIENQLI